MGNELWALLWSRRANCFHIEPLHKTAESGMRFFRINQANDYLLIAVDSRREIETMADELRPVVLERETVRRLYDPE